MAYHNAHAAKINGDGIVEQVVVIPYCDDDDTTITRYCNSIGLSGTWIDTSYLGSRRGKFASISDRYDHQADTFVSTKEK